ncbi:LLM class flavin-dependent oxidoreductase [Kibdelosporangium phytohabitans]|uniref:Oxidoreductase n=1 Tax=Kibdelosporangium phytohabitans TaxID=860235 RepID=A0A0N9IIN8_9PSEU|nr:oxidoreductase [Kibdelosporangium phytohabitans]MBE1470010.1 alkanesulfonate monooxygenase SsuD/methylene tetrahydromethanopterin reductase-like flavin-dependent oxidoreductase (luciferase family) [Kibdelosporangium phytohabitans]
MTSLATVFRPQMPPESLRGFVRAVEDAGFDELWVWEDCFLESGIATAATALALSDRLKVGVGLLPVPLRNVALATMEAATLYRLFPGRVLLGLGHGVQDWMGQVGARAESPLTLLREYAVAMRSLLAGGRVTTEGRYVKLRDVELGWPPQTVPPLYVGATGPRSVRLSGEVADATILTSATTPDVLRTARQLIDEGRAAAGRSGHHHVVVSLLTATGAGAAERLAADNEGAQAGVAGNAEQVAAAVRRLAEAGADTVVLQPTADEPDPAGFVRFAAEQVRPLI